MPAARSKLQKRLDFRSGRYLRGCIMWSSRSTEYLADGWQTRIPHEDRRYKKPPRRSPVGDRFPGEGGKENSFLFLKPSYARMAHRISRARTSSSLFFFSLDSLSIIFARYVNRRYNTKLFVWLFYNQKHISCENMDWDSGIKYLQRGHFRDVFFLDFFLD